MKNLDMSFEEKSIWVSLLIILFVFVGYFSQVFEGMFSGSLDKADIFAMFIGAIISVVVLQIVLHSVIAIFAVKDAQSSRDERDRLFAMKSGNISGLVLGISVMMISLVTLAHEFNSLWVANILLFAVFVSQIVDYVLQIIYYRRGY